MWLLYVLGGKVGPSTDALYTRYTFLLNENSVTNRLRVYVFEDIHIIIGVHTFLPLKTNG